MVVVGGFVEERPAASFTVVLHLTRVNELVPFQRRGRVEALSAGPAAKRRHVHRRSVLPVDDSAVASLSGSPSDDPATSFIVSDLLVFLQLEVVKKSLAAQVTHERL